MDGPALSIDRTTWRAVNFWTPQYLQSQGIIRQVRFIVLHQTEGTYPTDVNYLCTAASNVSSHYYIRRDGATFELLSPANAAWHAGTAQADKIAGAPLRAVWGFGNENYHSVGIEMEALRDQGKTSAQVSSAAALMRYLRTLYPAIADDRLHIVGHSELTRRKVDPAPWDWASFMPLIRGARFFPQTGQSIQGGFRDFFEANGEVARFGYPLTGEEGDPGFPGLTVQYFENCRFEWRPGATVRLGAVGRMYLQSVGRIP